MSRTLKRRVVVTGLGCISPVGNSIASAWEAIKEGQSGIATITKFDATPFSTHFAGEVKGFNVEEYISAKEARNIDTFIHYGIAAGSQALQDSGLTVTEENADRIGVIVGSGIGGLPMIEETKETLLERGPRRISPFFVPASIINMISGHLSIKYGLKGPNLSIVTACTTGLHCIGSAARMIEYGDADAMIAVVPSPRFPRSVSVVSRQRVRCRRATTIRKRLRVRGTKTATASCWVKALA